jgi:hypothetical protein
MNYVIYHKGTGEPLGKLELHEPDTLEKCLAAIAADYDFAPYDLEAVTFEEAIKRADQIEGVTHIAPGIFMVNGSKQENVDGIDRSEKPDDAPDA